MLVGSENVKKEEGGKIKYVSSDVTWLMSVRAEDKFRRMYVMAHACIGYARMVACVRLLTHIRPESKDPSAPSYILAWLSLQVCVQTLFYT